MTTSRADHMHEEFDSDEDTVESHSTWMPVPGYPVDLG